MRINLSSLVGVTVCAAVILAGVEPAWSADRDAIRKIKGLAVQSGNAKIIEAMKVLEDEGFLETMAGGGDSADVPAAASSEDPAPAASSASVGTIDAERAKEIALAHARPKLGAMGAGAEVMSVTEKAGPPKIFRVKIMPGTKATLCFFMSYNVDVDASTGAVLRMK